MLRGCRFFIVALGLILAGAGPPHDKAVQHQASEQVGPTTPPTPNYAPYPHYNPDPCYHDKNHDTADLCAQWRAALAAEKTTGLSYWGNWIAAGAAILSFASIVLVVCALRQTDKSLQIAQKDRATATRRAVAQSDETKIALASAKKSANAMAKVATTLNSQSKLVAETVETNRRIADNQESISALQLRAYVSVVIGNAVYQETAKNLRFEARPTLVNSGSTPAEKVRHRIKAGIFPVPLPVDVQLPLDEMGDTPDALLPPGQNRIMSATIDTLYPDDQVQQIMRGDGSGLYVWGDVAYTDAFGKSHTTEFCQHLTWLCDGEGKLGVMGYYIAGRNHMS